MKRRSLLALAAATPLPARAAAAQQQAARATRALPSPKIKDVQVIATAPAGLRLAVVKVVTDQDGLYGYGCATFTQRADLVVPAVERYLKPFLLGKPADRIDDLWQAMYNSSYWRNGPVLNNGISGVDQALWDIKGRMANMPVYQLLGGKCREAADCYAHASGAEIPQVIESAKRYLSQGYRHIRVQVGVPGMAGYGSGRGEARVTAPAPRAAGAPAAAACAARAGAARRADPRARVREAGLSRAGRPHPPQRVRERGPPCAERQAPAPARPVHVFQGGAQGREIREVKLLIEVVRRIVVDQLRQARKVQDSVKAILAHHLFERLDGDARKLVRIIETTFFGGHRA